MTVKHLLSAVGYNICEGTAGVCDRGQPTCKPPAALKMTSYSVTAE
jgi:hypothetical protein